MYHNRCSPWLLTVIFCLVTPHIIGQPTGECLSCLPWSRSSLCCWSPAGACAGTPLLMFLQQGLKSAECRAIAEGHSYKWSLMRQLNVHPKGNKGAELAECILLTGPKGGYTWAFLRNQKYPTCGQSVERGVGTLQPQFWAHSINSWLTICSLPFALFSFQKVFSQQTFNLCFPPPFTAGPAIINNDSGFSGHHLNFPAACSDFNL